MRLWSHNMGSSMKRTKIALVHTSKVLIPLFEELCKELLPHVEVVHTADDSLIKDTIAHGSLSESVTRRLQGYILEVQRAGAELIMVTCSSLGPAVEASQTLVKVPLLRVDRAMAEEAVSKGVRIGVIATVETTLGPTVDLIERLAKASGKQALVTATLCDGALEKFLCGETEAHDRMVTEKLMQMIPTVDVVVLAQASMARVANRLPAGSCTIPLLSSPRLAIESLARSIA